jgi:hypothetical protein
MLRPVVRFTLPAIALVSLFAACSSDDGYDFFGEANAGSGGKAGSSNAGSGGSTPTAGKGAGGSNGSGGSSASGSSGTDGQGGSGGTSAGTSSTAGAGSGGTEPVAGNNATGGTPHAGDAGEGGDGVAGMGSAGVPEETGGTGAGMAGEGGSAGSSAAGSGGAGSGGAGAGSGGAGSGGGGAGGSAGTSGGGSGGSGGNPPVECEANADCDDGEYCQKQACAAAKGVCAAEPTMCLGSEAVFSPVCGCDRMTYYSPCVAAREGVNVESSGECSGSGLPTCTRAGGGDSCTPQRYKARCYRPRVGCDGTSSNSGVCWVLPDECPDEAKINTYCGGTGGDPECVGLCEVLDRGDAVYRNSPGCAN